MDIYDAFIEYLLSLESTIQGYYETIVLLLGTKVVSTLKEMSSSALSITTNLLITIAGLRKEPRKTVTLGVK